MSHDTSRIYTETVGGVKYGVSIADIQTILGLGNKDIGGLIVNGNINPMAKYKPIKSSKLGILTDTDRENARYGMADPIVSLRDFLPPATPPAWIYEKPTLGAPNEWFRFLDFDGYDHNAVTPIAMIIRRLTIGGRFGIEVYMDSYVNAYYSNIGSSKQWSIYGNLSIDDLLSSGMNDISNSYVGFVFQDLTNDQFNTVVTNRRFKDISGVEAFIFHPEGGQGPDGAAYEDGLGYPPIPILNESNRAGRNFKVTLAVFPHGNPSSNYAYQVVAGYYISGSGEPGYSLGFNENDRTDQLTIKSWSASDVSSLRGTLSSGPTLRLVGNYDNTWAEYEITSDIYGTLTTPPEWTNPANLGVSVTASVIGGTGFIGSVPALPSTNTVTKTKSIALPYMDYTYTNQNLATFTEHVFLPRGVSGLGITITAKFTQIDTQEPIEAAFDNSLSLTI